MLSICNFNVRDWQQQTWTLQPGLLKAKSDLSSFKLEKSQWQQHLADGQDRLWQQL